MAFFDDLGTLGKKFSETGKQVAGKAKDITGSLQLRAKLSSEQDALNKAYAEIGRDYYEQHADDAETEHAAEFAKIEEIRAKMADIQSQIDELEGARNCPVCGARVPRGARFCSSCGNEMDPADAPEETVEAAETVEPDEQGEEQDQ